MKLKEKISFDNLKQKVIEKGLCNRCGGCVSFCSADRIGALEIGEDGFPRYADKEKCLECGICYLICPQTHILKEEVEDEFGWKAPIGLYQDIFSARATDKNILKVATDGGVVTSLLSYMLENNLIDGAVVSKKTGLFSRKSIIATSHDELIQAAGSQFSEANHLEKMGAEYTTFVPTIPIIRELAPKTPLRLAVVGTPCQIQAIKKMQVLRILPSDVIIFTIGLFCMQSFALDDLMKRKFARKHRINLKGIVKLNVKEDFIITMDSERTVHIPLEEIEEIARPACLACKDFANDYADISVGGLGSPDGYTTVLTRTVTGQRIYTEALHKDYIENKKGNSQLISVEKSKTLSLIEAFAERKRKRADKRLNEIHYRPFLAPLLKAEAITPGRNCNDL
ncbi:Coenzyme F420 hydrogenase/dehydrogenase, beta subunit C-terminal domain [candidate division WOR-3 bacterium]|nr:Coenzyme F420 hydrogenase/dehydrogenase, beta subunit C-terminal domain [candidate division WOR-3 bacterium]